MDQERQIRFLYPPILTVAFFCWAYLSDPRGLDNLGIVICYLERQGEVGASLLALLAGSSLILVLGFAQGTVTYLLLRGFANLRGWQSHEFPPERCVQEKILNSVYRGSNSFAVDPHMATVWLDFELCPKGVHEWIARRWNAFNVSVNTGVGLVIVMIGFPLIWPQYDTFPIWYGTGLTALLILLINAKLAWKEAMNMLEFATLPVRKTADQHDNGTSD